MKNRKRTESDLSFPDTAPMRLTEGVPTVMMTRPSRYALRMVVFVAMVAIVTALLHEQVARGLGSDQRKCRTTLDK